MFRILFSPIDKENACGMFTLPHIISIIVCFSLVALGIFLCRHITKDGLIRLTRIFAYVFTVCEIIKIIYKFSYGYTEKLDFWFPISYCSLFIYTLWMVGFGKDLIYKLGVAFISIGGFAGGFSYILIPATSLMDYPIYHFLSIHSMLFHTAMVFMSILYIYNGLMRVCKKNYVYFALFVASACIIATVINCIADCNLMLMRAPVNIPIELINTVYDKIPVLYTVGALIVYCTCPFLFGSLIQFISDKIKQKRLQ